MNKTHGNFKHGGSLLWNKRSMKNSSELGFYRRYLSMKRRCETETDSSYKFYGGRGIKNEWKSFFEFKRKMWISFLKHVSIHGLTNTTLDRVNGDENYSVDNCRWATRKIQATNTHQARLLNHGGKSDSLNGWSKRQSIPRKTITRRIDKYGWDIKKALTTPAPGRRGSGRGRARVGLKT